MTLKRRTLLKACVIGAALAFPIARISLQDNGVIHTHARFSFSGDEFTIQGVDHGHHVQSLIDMQQHKSGFQIHQLEWFTPEERT
jgi:hypothetical protein